MAEPIQKFVVVEHYETDKFQEEVTRYLNLGYKLHGEMITMIAPNNDRVFMQAMVRYGIPSYG